MYFILVAIFVSIYEFHVNFCFRLLPWLCLKGITMQESLRITIVNDNESIMTNIIFIYMSELIVTEEQKEKHGFIGIQLKILPFVLHALRFQIKLDNCSHSWSSLFANLQKLIAVQKILLKPGYLMLYMFISTISFCYLNIHLIDNMY